MVTAALEVEAHSYDHEWKSEDEDTIRLIAHVSGSVLDMIDNIKLQVTSSSTSSLPTSHAAEIILLHHKDMRRVLLHLQFPKNDDLSLSLPHHSEQCLKFACVFVRAACST